MFTGLVEDIGRIVRVTRRERAAQLEIAPAAISVEALALGESIAIDGTCLTVTRAAGATFEVLAAEETLRRTTLGNLFPGGRVNLERAVRPEGRLGGHLVSGHVDGIAEVSSRRPAGEAVAMELRAPTAILRYVVEKGSIAIDGISLTVNRVDEYAFAVALIPHTLVATTIGDKAVGARVNIEVDVVAKYVEKFVKEHLSR